ncbi:DNA-binding protein [Zavarzinia sp.]|uniref:DNA-binding protein n=1 Tax=Zavarzinia sp. TaxID=2027920 RepID=UPI003BB684B2
MASQVVKFTGLSDRDRKIVAPLPRLAEGDSMELHVRRTDGQDHTLTLPAAAIGIVETLIDHLLSGERVAVIAEDQELSPTEASSILGISRPLVVLRMDRGDLPFRYVGKHRRASLRDVLALKAQLDARQKALDALADDTEDLIVNHGL